MLVECEGAEANNVTVKFRSKVDVARFNQLKAESPIDALRATGYPVEARRVIINQITMGMVSDCLHHIYEAFICLEKRKIVVAFNLLRKPFLDNLLYLSWMLGDEDGFYAAFTSGDPNLLSSKALGNRRRKIIVDALERTEVADVLNSSSIEAAIFDPDNAYGLYRLFQRAVHLITVQRIQIQTEPENFNFIFKDHRDDDLYYGVYEQLPGLMLYLSHIVIGLFDRMAGLDPSSKAAFFVRSTHGFYLLQADGVATEIRHALRSNLGKTFVCASCDHRYEFTLHNARRAALTETNRCVACRRINALPLSWMF